MPRSPKCFFPSLYNFLQLQATSSLIDPYFLLSTLFTNIFYLNSCHRVKNKFYTHIKQHVKS
jgi:hypothetical protein